MGRMEKGTATLRILQIKNGKERNIEDVVAGEIPLTIFLNGEELTTLLCTPDDLIYLVVGFLATSGFITKKEDIKKLEIDKQNRKARVLVKDKLPLLKKRILKKVVPSGCGKGGLFYNPGDILGLSPILSGIRVGGSEILRLLKRFTKASSLFIKTGGVHSCAVCKEGVIIELNDDIGRHNAVDKVFGKCLLEGVPLDDKLLLTSGRITSEIILKVARMGCPIVVSRCAPTDLAIGFAARLGITVIGFARRERMNIYTHSERVIFDGNC